MVNKNSNNPVILFPNMGEGIMPDNEDIISSLEKMGAEVIKADISIPETIRELPWEMIDAVDLRCTRGSLTNYDVYLGLINRIIDKIEAQKSNGHNIKIFPEYDAVKWIASKANYINYLQDKSIPTIPGKIIKRHSSNNRPSTIDADNIKQAVNDVMNYINNKSGSRFVLKPSICSLAKRIVFIDCNENGSYKIEYPRIDRDSDIFLYEDDNQIRNFLFQYLEMTTSPDEMFLIQEYVDNIEISAVFINGIPHFVKRTCGDARVAHYKYGGKDEIIENPDASLRFFVKQICGALPKHIMNAPFLRIDVMWDNESRKYMFAEIEGAGAARLWIQEADRVDDYAYMLMNIASQATSMDMNDYMNNNMLKYYKDRDTSSCVLN